jgi:hypothetical protein
MIIEFPSARVFPGARMFPRSFTFPDVDPPVLARDEGITLDARRLLDGAWTDYLRRMLPPVAEQTRRC